MDPVSHCSFGFGLKQQGDVHTLIPRGARLPVCRQVTLPIGEFYRTTDDRSRVVLRVPLRQGHGARAISLGTLEIVSSLVRPKFCRVVFRLSAGLLFASVTIGHRAQSVSICVETGPSRRPRTPPWTQVGPLVRDADQSSPNVRPFMHPR